MRVGVSAENSGVANSAVSSAAKLSRGHHAVHKTIAAGVGMRPAEVWAGDKSQMLQLGHHIAHGCGRERQPALCVSICDPTGVPPVRCTDVPKWLAADWRVRLSLMSNQCIKSMTIL